MNYKPTAFHVVVLPDEVETKTASGIILAVDERLEKAASVYGKLVAVGPTAWKAFDQGQPWAKEGDRVMYAKYSGKFFSDESTGIVYVLLNDEDILAVVPDKE